MDRPRLAGGAVATSIPSIRMAPPLTSSSPAISRSSVDLPQPEGPTNTTNSPSLTARSMPGMISASPNFLRTLRRTISPIRRISGWLLRSFHGSEGEAAHELTLREPAEQQNGRDGQRRRGGQLRPEQPLRGRERGDEGGERRRVGGRQVERPERFVPRQDDVEKQRRRYPGHRHGQEHVNDLLPQLGAVHARGLEDVDRDLLA